MQTESNSCRSPSPLAGKGGAKRRMRGLVQRVLMLAIRSLNQPPHLSSSVQVEDDGPLPLGERVN